VYDVDGLRDSVQDGVTGVVTRSNTPEALADAIVELLSSPDAYDSKRELGWEWSTHLTFDQCYADFCGMLREEGILRE
jgi:glycosyltransferase involved in cell wall biosynthesis